MASGVHAGVSTRSGLPATGDPWITGVVVASKGTAGAGGGGVTGVTTTATPGLVAVCVTYPVLVPVTATEMLVPTSPATTR
ncbi:hypothetical protein BFL35_09820 [Clavibacter michiganensis]|nr:hypothetical protein BFL35_09820 [Clavibacter michiganensis]